LAVSLVFTRLVLKFDASGASERAIIRGFVPSLAVVAHAVLDHVAFAVVRRFTATLRQVQVRVLFVVDEVKCRASFDLLAIVGSKGAIDPAPGACRGRLGPACPPSYRQKPKQLSTVMLGCFGYLGTRITIWLFFRSGTSGSNRRPQAWEARALPTELVPQCSDILVVLAGLASKF
jgi:hypothetical protein